MSLPNPDIIANFIVITSILVLGFFYIKHLLKKEK